MDGLCAGEGAGSGDAGAAAGGGGGGSASEAELLAGGKGVQVKLLVLLDVLAQQGKVRKARVPLVRHPRFREIVHVWGRGPKRPSGGPQDQHE